MSMTRVMMSVAVAIQVAAWVPERPDSTPSIESNHQSQASVQDPGILAKLPRWTISSKPMLTIREDGPDREFSLVSGFERLPNGDYLVADHNRNQVKHFDSSGKYLKTLTRVGDGPGEFRGLSWISYVDDKLYFSDNYSLSEFRLDGTFVRRLLVPLVVHPLGRLAGGATAVASLDGGNMSPPGTSNHVRDDGTMTYGIVARDSGVAVQWLPPLKRQSFMWYTENGSYPSMSHAAWFTPGPCATVSGKYFWVGYGGRPELSLYDGSGATVRTVTFPLTPRAFDEAAIKRVRDREYSAQTKPIDKRYADFRFAKRHRPKTAPLFSRFIAGVNGEVWIELFREDPLDVPRYVVMGPDGKALAAVTGLDPRVKIIKIDRDYVAGVMKDDDGIPFVVIYPLKRSRG